MKVYGYATRYIKAYYNHLVSDWRRGKYWKVAFELSVLLMALMLIFGNLIPATRQVLFTLFGVNPTDVTATSTHTVLAPGGNVAIGNTGTVNQTVINQTAETKRIFAVSITKPGVEIGRDRYYTEFSISIAPSPSKGFTVTRDMELLPACTKPAYVHGAFIINPYSPFNGQYTETYKFACDATVPITETQGLFDLLAGNSG